MLIQRSVGHLNIAVGFVLGVLFSCVFVVDRIHDYSHFGIGRGMFNGSERKNGSVNSKTGNLEGCELIQQDNTFVARQLRQKVKILCYIQTIPQTLQSRARYVKLTWGKRCDVLIFGSDYLDTKFPTMNITIPHGRQYLALKSTRAFDYIYANHRDDADWFFKCDDDSYVIMENLRYFLSAHDPKKPLSFGHAFEHPDLFYSGGSGYVLSREALNRWAGRPKGRCREKGTHEDHMMGTCLASLGVKLGDTRDAQGRHRFNPAPIMTHLTGKFNSYMLHHNKYKNRGFNSLSDYPVSFHYVRNGEMLELEYFLYHSHVYGIVGGLQRVNPTEAPPDEPTKRNKNNSSESRK